jgi:RHS repeat-associated protein
LVEHIRADGSVVRNQYDSFGRMYGSTDALGRQSWIRLDGDGNVMGTTQPEDAQHPAGIRTDYRHDPSGRIIERTDPTGAITRYQYDAYKRLTQITFPDGSSERYSYPDPKEHPLICDSPIQIEDARGGVKRIAYNNAGQMTRYTDCSGESTAWDYDRWGQGITVTDAQGHRARHERDSAGRITATHLPNGQTRRYQYDSKGNLTRIEPDANTPEAALEITRDLWGRPTRIEQGGLAVQSEYDKAGRLTALTNENGSRSRFVWDVMDQLTQETGFDGRVQRYRRDAAGQLIASKDGAGQESDPVTEYRHDQLGRFVERLLTTTGSSAAQSHCFEWDELKRLKAANVYLLGQAGGQIQKQLQSRVQLERDSLGRITAEVQCLYKEPAKPGQPPALEYQHRIEHKLDPLGNRQHSELQNIGGIDWLRYGSGHVHGLMLGGQSLLDFERDRLHRETKRTLHGLDDIADLTLTRSRDSLGRLNGIDLQGLKGGSLPPILIGQITSRQYHYNPLSELIAIQMPDETLGFGYDAAGRLREQAHYDTREYMQALIGQAVPHTTRRWKIDPAGNRLPVKTPDEQQQRESWAEQVHRRWQDPEFNLLGEGSAPKQQQGPINQWPDNRIAFDEHSAWRYDNPGNRVEQMSYTPQGRYERQRLYFDGANQLTALQVDSTDGSGPAVMQNAARYVYDALGRRLKKTVKDQNGKEHVTYFGWDGDRQVHTETVKEDGTREIVHIIYEPGSFTPMVRLSTTVDAKAWQPKPHFIVQAALAGLTQRQKNNEAVWDDLQAMQNALERMSGHDSGQMEKTLRRALLEDPPTNRLVGLGPHLDNMMTIEDMRRGLQEQEAQEIKTPVVVHYFHTDHLGTPLALTDQQGKMVWASRLDPWGNVENEYNPHRIEQNIRLPGQYYDKESGLYYNRHRYYDPKIGGYINQDPIGLEGGINLSLYVQNPLSWIDPFGLVDLKISGATGQNSIHANPGPGAVSSSNAMSEHLPSHVHLGNNDGPRVNTDDFQPYSEKDKRRMTRQQQKFVCKLSDQQKKLIQARQEQVYKTGQFEKSTSVGGGGVGIQDVGGGGFSPRVGPLGAEVDKAYPAGGAPFEVERIPDE